MSRWKRENAFDAIIDVAGRKHGVEPALIKAVIARESGFRPTAARSEVRARDASAGLMQILYSTAKSEGYTGTFGSSAALTGLFDPATNIEYGTRYLRACLNRTAGTPNAISMYNGGYRPALGFGEQATRPLTICLARDQGTGKCIKTRNVVPGEFANQEHVDAVMANYAYFKGQVTPKPPTAITPSGAGPTPGPVVVFAPNALGTLALGLLGIAVAVTTGKRGPS